MPRTLEQTNDIQQLYEKESIIKFLKSPKMDWLSHFWRADNSLIKTILVNRKILYGQPKQRWLNKVKRMVELRRNEMKVYFIKYEYITDSSGCNWFSKIKKKNFNLK